ncbi:hypothetical protein [Streptococcus suis]|nr:hypothetical protein [Streptococcus suis]
MPASGAVDGGLCAVGAGGEVERGVGRYSSAIYGKEKEMNELERTALNEILRTVTYIAEKVDELDAKISLSDLQVLEHQEN